MVQTTGESAMNWLQLLISALGGAVLTFVGLRTKIALIDRRIESRKAEIERLERQLKGRLDSIERKQTLLLQIVADVANKVGVDKRFSDIVVKFLADEEGINDEKRS